MISLKFSHHRSQINRSAMESTITSRLLALHSVLDLVNLMSKNWRAQKLSLTNYSLLVLSGGQTLRGPPPFIVSLNLMGSGDLVEIIVA